MPLIGSMATRMRSSETTTERWVQANRSGGDRHRAWVELNEEIRVELPPREGEIKPTARADDEDDALAQSSQSVPRYPRQFAVDLARIEREY